MADLTPEVKNALVQLMTGAIAYEEFSVDDLLAIGEDFEANRQRIALALRAKGVTFAEMGRRWGGVHEVTVWRWAHPKGKNAR